MTDRRSLCPSVAEGRAHNGSSAVEVAEGFQGFGGSLKKDRAGFIILFVGEIVGVRCAFRTAEIANQDRPGIVPLVGAVHRCHGEHVLDPVFEFFAAASSAVDMVERYRARMDLIFNLHGGVSPGEKHQHPGEYGEQGDQHHDSQQTHQCAPYEPLPNKAHTHSQCKQHAADCAHHQTFFGEAELACTDDFIKIKHGKDFEKFVKEIPDDGRILYTYDNGTVTYIYEFTEL